MTEIIKVPEIGENVDAGVVVVVHIKAGDIIHVDDTVIEIETDKALIEIPSTMEGLVVEVLADPGDLVHVGDIIAKVDSGSISTAFSNNKTNGSFELSNVVTTDVSPSAVLTAQSKAISELYIPWSATPSLRHFAIELGIDICSAQDGSLGGRISNSDIKAHMRRPKLESGMEVCEGHSTAATNLLEFSRWGKTAVEEMDAVRRLTASRTAAGWSTIPHVTQFDEADISGVMAFMDQNFRRAEEVGARLTLTAIITRICAEALRHFPRFNASIDVANNRIIFKKYINIGIAVDTPRGLLVPVIRDADGKNIIYLAKTIGDLAARARNKKIKPDEMEGGTFTISNQGGIGGVGFTPIVLWPQVAVLGISRSAIRPIYLKDRFEPRTILPLSLSYDHRLIDGADAVRFLRWICDGLKQPLNLFLD